jgi:flagellar assembly protein FliH
MIRRADHNERARNAIVLNLGDIRAQMDAMIAKAQDDATQIIEDARRERDRLISSATREGRSAGHAEGLALGRAEGAQQGRLQVIDGARTQLEVIRASWEGALGKLEESRRSLLEDAREDVVRFAAAVASRVAKRVVELNPDAVVAQVAECLALITKGHHLVVVVHPEDLPMVKIAWPALVERFSNSGDCALVGDESLSRGSCLVRKGEGGRGQIDAGIQKQIDRIVRAVMPQGDPEPQIEEGPA